MFNLISYIPPKSSRLIATNSSFVTLIISWSDKNSAFIEITLRPIWLIPLANLRKIPNSRLDEASSADLIPVAVEPNA